MDASEIITALGGRVRVAQLTGRKPNAVTQWRTAGIPADCWHLLVAEAKQKNVDGIDFDTLRATRASREGVA